MIMKIRITTSVLLLSTLLAIGFVSTGCGDSNSTSDGAADAVTTESKENKAMSSSAQAMMMPAAPQQHFIPADTANVMISSYLRSINYQLNDTDLRSVIIDADSLRAYLSDAGVTKIKIMFAHTLDYINNGGRDQPAGYKSTALTFVIAGYDKDDNYLFYLPTGGSGLVLNHAMPCPMNCPTTGTASQDLLPTQ